MWVHCENDLGEERRHLGRHVRFVRTNAKASGAGGASASAPISSLGSPFNAPAKGNPTTAYQAKHGIAKGQITIGVMVPSEDTSKQLAAYGLNVSYGNTKAMYHAVIDDLNKRGGLFGRKVVPIFRDINIATPNLAADYEASCTAFTQDNHVFAVMVWALTTDNFSKCLYKRGVPLILSAPDQNRAALEPNVLSVAAPDLDIEYGKLYVEGLARQHWFKPKTKIGVLYTDTPTYRTIKDHDLVPALKAIGQTVTSEYAVSKVESTSDATKIESQVQSAVLRFNTAGVTHVMMPIDYAATFAFFTQAAQNQHYFPTYGVT